MNDHDQIPECQPGAGIGHEQGRRKFLRAGAVATPAVLTLASQPALGVTCFTPSRSLSRNTSLSQAGHFGDCTNAASPEAYRKNSNPNRNIWPQSDPPNTPFHPIFSGSTFMLTENQVTRSLTMLEVLSLGTGGTHTDPEGVAKHIIAAYLNIKGGNNAVIPSNVLTVSQLKLIWTGWNTNGKYEVMANIFWNGAQIKNYLISNGIVG